MPLSTRGRLALPRLQLLRLITLSCGILGASGGCQPERFHRVADARDCLAERFVRRPSAAAAAAAECGTLCVQAGGACRAFSIDGATPACRLFVFDACSRGLLTANCSRTSAIFVRQSGWPASDGRLCPDGFRFAPNSASDFTGSLYRRTSAQGTWNGTRTSCDSAAPGLSKLADLDGGVGEMKAAAASVGATASDQLWVSARRPIGSPAAAASWDWVPCGGGVDGALFGSSPDFAGDQTAARMKESGGRIADYAETTLLTGVCECLDPFIAG